MAIGDEGMPRAGGRGASGEERKAPAEERVRGVNDLNRGLTCVQWIIE